MLPLIEAHVEYTGPATYDDLLNVATAVTMAGRARVRFDAEITHAADGAAVARGHTVHAVVDTDRRPIRPPDWLVQLLERGNA